MIKFEKTDVWGFQHAIRGMRNPLNSWERSDSEYVPDIVIGNNDKELMIRLIRAGATHRKFLRQIFVSVDITAPLYWWKEFDTYKVGTTANSCSTMHKIASRHLEPEDFSVDYIQKAGGSELLGNILEGLNEAIDVFTNFEELSKSGKIEKGFTKKDVWYTIIQLLPSGYNQKRTVTMTYENLLNMLETRQNHKLDEWRQFCDWILTLPYAELLKEGTTKQEEA